MIELQSEQREKIADILQKLEYKVKIACSVTLNQFDIFPLAKRSLASALQRFIEFLVFLKRIFKVVRLSLYHAGLAHSHTQVFAVRKHLHTARGILRVARLEQITIDA